MADTYWCSDCGLTSYRYEEEQHEDWCKRNEKRIKRQHDAPPQHIDADMVSSTEAPTGPTAS